MISASHDLTHLGKYKEVRLYNQQDHRYASRSPLHESIGPQVLELCQGERKEGHLWKLKENRFVFRK
jgi:hypothetical protein